LATEIILFGRRTALNPSEPPYNLLHDFGVSNLNALQEVALRGPAPSRSRVVWSLRDSGTTASTCIMPEKTPQRLLSRSWAMELFTRSNPPSSSPSSNSSSSNQFSNNSSRAGKVMDNSTLGAVVEALPCRSVRFKQLVVLLGHTFVTILLYGTGKWRCCGFGVPLLGLVLASRKRSLWACIWQSGRVVDRRLGAQSESIPFCCACSLPPARLPQRVS
jgi:hypothetical protein